MSAQLPSFTPEKGATSRRAHALEFSRAARAKAIAIAALRVLSACSLSALLGVGAVQGYRWATRAPFFALRDVQVRGNQHARSDELIARSGLFPGQNLFRVDLAAAARGVESSPWVLAASVSRQLPSSIELEVREHVPVARVLLGSGDYFSDAEGKLFKRVAADDDAPERALPLVSGISRDDWDARREESLGQLKAALALISDWREAGLSRDELIEVRRDPDGAFTALSHQGQLVQEVRVGRGPFAANLHRLARVRLELQRRAAQASRIDLDNPARPDEVAAQIVRNDDPSTTRPKVSGARGE